MAVELGPDFVFGAAVEAIVTIVDGAFPVYTEQVMQRFQMPCIFVFQTACREERGLGDASWRVYKIEATFNSGREGLSRYQELREWSSKLVRALRGLTVTVAVGEELPLKASSIETKHFDESAVVYASYRVHAREQSVPSAIAGDLAVNIENK